MVALVGVIPDATEGQAHTYLHQILCAAAMKCVIIHSLDPRPWELYFMEQIIYIHLYRNPHFINNGDLLRV